MSIKPINQKGFAVVEAVLVVAVLAIVGGTGYYVFQANNKATDTQNPAQTAVNTVAPHKKSDNPAKAKVATTAVFKIPELAVEVTVPNSIKDIVYKYNGSSTLSTGQTTKSVTVSTQSLSDLDKDCSVTGSAPALGAVSKTDGQYPKSATFENSSGVLIKQFTDYYVAWQSSQAACGSGSVVDKAAQGASLFKTSLKTVQPIQ